MKLEHTPGPWKGKDIFFYAQDIIGICATFADDKTEAKANARLIAAAPDMLNALTEVIKRNESAGNPLCIEIAYGAVERATGKTIEEIIKE